MTEFMIEVTGRRVAVRALFESTREYCAGYLCGGEPQGCVVIGAGDLRYEREQCAREDALEGLPVREHSDAYLEITAVQRKIAEELVGFDVLLFHGSVVAVDGVAYLFTAKSGTGKSTHTRFWRQVFGERAQMVNDDTPLLKLTEDGVLACGTPWDGKHRLSSNVCLPLKAICVLERGDVNEIHRISPQEALPMVFQQTYRPKKLGKYMEIIDKLTERVAFYRLRCNMTPEAAKVAYEAMK